MIDHHAIEIQPKSAAFIHDVTNPAGLLCYELCQQHGLGSPELDRLVHLNNVGDLFLEDDPDFVAGQRFRQPGQDLSVLESARSDRGPIGTAAGPPAAGGDGGQTPHRRPAGLRVEQAQRRGNRPAVGFVDTVVGNTNLIVHQLLEKKATQYPVLLTLFRKANNTVVVSLRSRNGEALKVAEKLQGGGHANACGATLPRSVKNIPDAVDYLRQPPRSRSEKGRTPEQPRSPLRERGD